jgi:hypothetical protein
MFASCGQISDRSIRVSNRQSECPSTALGELTDSKRHPTAEERGFETMKEDAYAEICLWNRNVARLVRVLQRLESFSIRPKQELKAYEVRLEEIRAALNADFAEVMAARERSDEARLRAQWTAWNQKRLDRDK